MESGSSVCAVKGAVLVGRRSSPIDWRSDFEVLGFLVRGCLRKECPSSIKAFGYLGMLGV